MIVLACACACGAPAPHDHREEVLPAARGEIHDRAGRIVATGGGEARRYPYGSLGAHAIGYVGEGSAVAGGQVGLGGVEQSEESVLGGRAGVRRVPLDERGRALPGATTIAATSGRDVVLTLDMALMEIVARAFSGHEAGAVVVVDVEGGAVRALFSAPSFDPGTVVRDATRLRDAASRPLLDRTIAQARRPGGTFKPITALAALRAGVLELDETMECRGALMVGETRFRDTAVHGDVTFERAIAASCNIYAYGAAMRVGAERLSATAGALGFGSATGIGLPGEVAGALPLDGATSVHELLNVAVGQSLDVTPLQLALAYAALANGGTLYEPRLVERIDGREGSRGEERAARVRGRLELSARDAAAIRRALEATVSSEHGTAYEHGGASDLRIAGKTGNGGRGRDRSDSWFVGYAPADEPELAIAVLVEGSDYGAGRAAVPIAIAILEEHFAR